jgi:phosphate starvation-inducible protein PhoH and related proteins
LHERSLMAQRKRKPINKKHQHESKVAKSHTNLKANSVGKNFHIEFKNEAQSLAWEAFQQHDVLFLVGPAGCGKTHIAAAFAIEQILNKKRNKIVLTRPIVEAGESLGFLPGAFEDKVHPYMMPLCDCMDQMVGKEGPWRERVDFATEVAPIAFMRGRSFHDAVCIFDEAQNASMLQLKLFLTRFGENSKIIITGDPTQSDIGGKVALVEVMQKLKGVEGIGIIEFKTNSIVRHSLVGKIIEKLEV